MKDLKEYHRIKSREHYLLNRDETISRHKKYNKDNIAKIRIWERSYHKTPEGYYRHLKKKAKERKRPFLILKQDFIEWLRSQKDICCYCEAKLVYNVRESTSPSIDRKDNNLGYTLENICLCCLRCNKMKNEFFTYEEMCVIGKTVKRVIKLRN